MNDAERDGADRGDTNLCRSWWAGLSEERKAAVYGDAERVFQSRPEASVEDPEVRRRLRSAILRRVALDATCVVTLLEAVSRVLSHRLRIDQRALLIGYIVMIRLSGEGGLLPASPITLRRIREKLDVIGIDPFDVDI